MTDTLTHAVTIHQPLAWAVASGHCPIIPSDTRPGMEHEGKLIGIHAGRTHLPELECVQFMLDHRELAVAPGSACGQMVHGALIGVARLVGVLRRVATNESGGYRFERMLGASVGEPIHVSVHERVKPWWHPPSPWRPGTKWGFLLTDTVLLPEPIPMRGAGGLWRIPLRVGEIGTDRTVFIRPAELALEQWQKARGA